MVSDSMTTSPWHWRIYLADSLPSTLTQPNMYARGILFGKMKYELGDHSFVRCPDNDLVADLEFKTKGYFTGTYDAIGGAIRNESTGEVFYELSGYWNGEMFIKDVTVCQAAIAFIYKSMLTIRTDWPKGAPIRCDKCKAHSSRRETIGGTGGTRIAKALARHR